MAKRNIINLKDASKDPETLINITGSISADIQSEIAIQICTDYRTDIDSRSSWEEKRNDWYKLWACIRPEKSDPWPNASNVCLPILATAANQFHARSYQSIFAPPGMVKTIPVGEADVKRAKNVEEYMNWQILYEMEEYEQEMDELLLMLPINGIAFKKVYYDAKLKRNLAETLNALDIVLPYKTKKLETARRIAHRLWLHYDELQLRDSWGLYSNFDKISESPNKEDESDLKYTVDDTTGITPTKSIEKPHLILEVHKDLVIGSENRKPYIFTVDYDTQTLLRTVKREAKQGATKITLNYFNDYHFIPNPEGFYSFGFGHFLTQLNEMANTAFNQIFDSGRLTNQPFGFYGRRAGIKNRKIKLHPGSMTEVNDASQIFFPSMQRMDQVLFQVIGVIQQYVERFTSTSDYLSGRESKGTKTPTAHGTLAIIEQGLVTFGVIAKRTFRSLRKELRLMMALNQIHVTETKQYRVVETEDKIAFRDIKAEDFKGVQDVIPIGDPSYASRETRRREARELYEILMTNPLIVGNPELRMEPNIAVMHEALSDVIETYDKKNKSKLLPDLPVDIVKPETENAMFFQGEYHPPQSGEDHMAHLTIHNGFKNGDFYPAMPKDYRPLLDRHIVETIQLAIQDEGRMRQLGGQREEAGAETEGAGGAVQPTQ